MKKFVLLEKTGISQSGPTWSYYYKTDKGLYSVVNLSKLMGGDLVPKKLRGKVFLGWEALEMNEKDKKFIGKPIQADSWEELKQLLP